MNMNATISTPVAAPSSNISFLRDVIIGLRADFKSLPSKYFYDDEGDLLFQQIMACRDYYLFDCELEIFENSSGGIADLFEKWDGAFDLIELGAGDATKTIYLLKELLKRRLDFTYLPIDISGHIIQGLEQSLPDQLTGLKLNAVHGEYFESLEKVCRTSSRPRAILFLGANIGNMPPSETVDFCHRLRNCLTAGDMVIVVFDLKKNPEQIRKAYDDDDGWTKKFNLNLLKRINKELGADFEVESFGHYCNYSPENGSCSSYLVALKDMKVSIAGQSFVFKRDECIWTETSHKYTLEEINRLADTTGFSPRRQFEDSRKWFVDVAWITV
jgi:L-histidine N-alpha-methyltransferase